MQNPSEMDCTCLCVCVCVCVCRVVCELQPSGKQRVGPVLVTVGTTPPGKSTQTFTYQVRGMIVQ